MTSKASTVSMAEGFDRNTISYTEHDKVWDIKEDPIPGERYMLPYGPKIPTAYMIKYGENRWRRLYVMNYGNAGSPYITVNGTVHFLDIDTRYLIEELFQ